VYDDSFCMFTPGVDSVEGCHDYQFNSLFGHRSFDVSTRFVTDGFIAILIHKVLFFV
jgi:hypothetical protein